MTTLTFAAKRLVLTAEGVTELSDSTLSFTFQDDLDSLSYSVLDDSNPALVPLITFDQPYHSVAVASGNFSNTATLHLGATVWSEGGETFSADTMRYTSIVNNSIVTYWIDLAGASMPLLESLEAAQSWMPESLGHVTLTRASEGENLLEVGYDDASQTFGNLTISEDDRLIGTESADTLNSGSGDDVIIAVGGDDILRGGDGLDRIDGGLGNDQIEGGNNSDILLGDFGDDVIKGGSGGDRIEGNEGDDTLRGNEGADRVLGGLGMDKMFGDEGDDYLSGGGSSDVIRGGEGEDILLGGSGEDRLLGETGDDVLKGGSGDDQAEGGDGDDVLFGNGGDDTLEGGEGADSMRGGNNSDVLYGGNGDDALRGDGGQDILHGGNGDDNLYGGSSRDVFVFLSSANESGRNRIKDWEDGKDQIDLSDLGFASFEDVLEAAMTQSEHVKITFSDGAESPIHNLIIEDFALEDFDASDVIL